MQRNFTDLVQELHHLLELESPAIEPADHEPLAVELTLDGMDCVLAHWPHDVERLSAYCRFGPLPEVNKVDVLCRLLQVNLVLSDTGPATLGVESDTGDVIYSFKAPLCAMSAGSLLRALRHVGRQAMEWRGNYFLGPGVSPPAGLVEHLGQLA